MGRYDFVVTLDCPDMESAMRVLNREAAGGNIRYETMVALPTREFARLFLSETELEEERAVLRVPRGSRKTGSRAAKTPRSRRPA